MAIACGALLMGAVCNSSEGKGEALGPPLSQPPSDVSPLDFDRFTVKKRQFGLDIAKNVFHAYGVDAQGQKVLNLKLCRAQVEAFFSSSACVVGIEVYATARIIGLARSLSWGIRFALPPAREAKGRPPCGTSASPRPRPCPTRAALIRPPEQPWR